MKKAAPVIKPALLRLSKNLYSAGDELFSNSAASRRVFPPAGGKRKSKSSKFQDMRLEF